jgi:hypothetical protein
MTNDKSANVQEVARGYQLLQKGNALIEEPSVRAPAALSPNRK